MTTGQKESEIKLLLQENSKLQDLSDGSVGLHCQAKCNHHHAVSTSSLTMEVETITRAFLWIVRGGDSQTTHAIILTDSVSWLQNVKSGMQSPD